MILLHSTFFFISLSLIDALDKLIEAYDSRAATIRFFRCSRDDWDLKSWTFKEIIVELVNQYCEENQSICCLNSWDNSTLFTPDLVFLREGPEELYSLITIQFALFYSTEASKNFIKDSTVCQFHPKLLDPSILQEVVESNKNYFSEWLDWELKTPAKATLRDYIFYPCTFLVFVFLIILQTILQHWESYQDNKQYWRRRFHRLEAQKLRKQRARLAWKEVRTTVWILNNEPEPSSAVSYTITSGSLPAETMQPIKDEKPEFLPIDTPPVELHHRKEKKKKSKHRKNSVEPETSMESRRNTQETLLISKKKQKKKKEEVEMAELGSAPSSGAQSAATPSKISVSHSTADTSVFL